MLDALLMYMKSSLFESWAFLLRTWNLSTIPFTFAKFFNSEVRLLKNFFHLKKHIQNKGVGLLIENIPNMTNGKMIYYLFSTAVPKKKIFPPANDQPYNSIYDKTSLSRWYNVYIPGNSSNGKQIEAFHN